VQIFLAFELDAVVQQRFDSEPVRSKTCIAAALVLMVLAAGLIIAPTMQHRLVEHGAASQRLLEVTTRVAAIALLPFALSLGLNLYVALERTVPASWALVAGLAVSLLALISWYGVGWWRRGRGPKASRMRKPEKPEKPEPTPLGVKIDHMLTEIRVILPGVQALLGFGLTAVLTQRYEQLPLMLKAVHAGSLSMFTMTVVLLMAPPAIHRLAFDGRDAPAFYRISSPLVTATSVPLALGLAGEVFVGLAIATDQPTVAALLAGTVLLALSALWFAWPLALRRAGRVD